jgi:hypothetical protein
MVYFYFDWLDYGLILFTTAPPQTPPGNSPTVPTTAAGTPRYRETALDSLLFLFFGPHAGPVRGVTPR